MPKSSTVWLLAAALALPAAAQHLPAEGAHGAVSSAEIHATQAGIAIMKQGGNAVDAAVAVGFTLAVTHSASGNIGGGGFMLVRQADGQSYFVDFREEAPGKASPTMYQDAQGNIVKGRSLVGMLASGIPGTVAGLVSAQQRLGKLTLAQDMAPAIRLAEQGFHLDAAEANGFRHARNLPLFPDSRRVFQRNGNYYKAGDLFQQPELAATLKRIAADGADGFYKGPVAQALAAFEKAHGGLITTADLAHYQAKWRQPLQVNYHGYDILTSPPPSSGGVAIVEMLNMLDHSDFVQAGMDSAEALHDEIEAQRRAMADRAVYLGDPDFVKIPMATLLSPAYAAQRWASVHPDQASLSKDVGAGPIPGFESDETTHFSTVDPAGDAVAVTYTLNFSYGSGVTAGHLGFLLNDEMDDFTSKPGAPNGFHLIQGKVNDIEPYKRPLSSMVPTIVAKDGKLALVLGSPGGPRIITTVFEVLTDVLDFGLNVQQAVDAPRFHQQWMPEAVYFEGPDRFSPDTLALLKKMGYPIRVQGTWCDVEAIQIDPKTGMRLAATDPRADGAAIAY
ncbi:MAG TPA: gamma-glutamyltransferase [Terriglobales bacterium]|nr:gamma-glutamyltransferase [Terriglobales bacterium]